MALCLRLTCDVYHRKPHKAPQYIHQRDVIRRSQVTPGVVVGVGGVGIDYLASVATFPKPDQKLRTKTLEVHGGGNCGNSMTGVARLGLQSRILSSVGRDTLGDAVVDEFCRDGVDTKFLQRQEDAATPFTYIIVDESGGTRTCIHTPGAALKPEDVSQELCNSVLEDAALVCFDGRLTEAAFVVARAAKAQGIPILVEAERLRPDLDMLMAEADYIVTSGHFPEDWTGEDNVGDAILATMLRLPAVKFMVTTFGRRGAVLLERVESPANTSRPETLESVIKRLQDHLGSLPKPSTSVDEPGCIAVDNVPIFPGEVTSTEPLLLTFDRTAKKEREALTRALAASQREAVCIAEDTLGHQGSTYVASSYSVHEDFGTETEDHLSATEDQTVTAKVYACTASPLSRDLVVDSTGAGDAFIASVIYGLVQQKSISETLKLATVVAATKCTKRGARPGIPRKEHLAEHLL